jgi:hypothetical protein
VVSVFTACVCGSLHMATISEVPMEVGPAAVQATPMRARRSLLSRVAIEVGDDPSTYTGRSINIYGVIMYKAAQQRSRLASCCWALLGLGLALATLAATLTLEAQPVHKRCMYSDDCDLGYVCVSEDENVTYHCKDCYAVEQRWRAQNAAARGTHITPMQRNDDFPLDVSTPIEYCNELLNLPWIRAWPDPPMDFSKCLHVQELRTHAYPLDFSFVVVALTFMLNAAAVGGDRHQQLYNTVLRKRWFPPAYHDPVAAVFVATELILNWLLLPAISAVLLLYVLHTDLFPVNVLLNGVAVFCILQFDDELVGLVPFDEVPKLEQAMGRAADGSAIAYPFKIMQAKASGRALITFTLLAVSFSNAIASAEPCFQIDLQVLLTLQFTTGVFLAFIFEVAVDLAAKYKQHAASNHSNCEKGFLLPALAKLAQESLGAIVCVSLYWGVGWSVYRYMPAMGL